MPNVDVSYISIHGGEVPPHFPPPPGGWVHQETIVDGWPIPPSPPGLNGQGSSPGPGQKQIEYCPWHMEFAVFTIYIRQNDQ